VVVSEESEEVKEEENKSEEVVQDEEKKDEWQISATAFDVNVPQFPIKEEWLQYKSARGGYILKFPSSNISYSVSSVKENFGRDDVKCSYVINVIKYSEKENLEISPAVRIYECDWSVEKSWAQGIIVYPRVDKKFVVQMNDGSWNDFSMNLKFEQLTEE
jgi:transposase